METKIFVPYDEIHSNPYKCVPDLDHIPTNILERMNKFWEENSKHICSQIFEALSRGFASWNTARDLVRDAIMETVNKLFMVFYYDNQCCTEKGVSTQIILDYIMNKLHHLDTSAGENNKRIDIYISAYGYPLTMGCEKHIECVANGVEMGYEKHVECVIYDVELNIIDFQYKTRDFKYVTTLYDTKFVEATIQLHNIVFHPEHDTFSGTLMAANYDRKRLIKKEK